VAVTRIVGGVVEGDFSEMLRLILELDICGSVRCGRGGNPAILRTEVATELLLLQRKSIMKRADIVDVTSPRMLIRSLHWFGLIPLSDVYGRLLDDASP